MKFNSFILIFILASTSIIEGRSYENVVELMRQGNSKDIEQFIESGEMNGYFSYDEAQNIISQLAEAFPHLVTLQIIGKSWEDRPIYVVTLSPHANFMKKREKPEILITSLHHARETISLSMSLILIITILNDYLQNNNNNDYSSLLIKHSNIHFIPIINPDSYALISLRFKEEGQFTQDMMFRKNRHTIKKCLKSTNEGVDLNRNYGYLFSHINLINGEDFDVCNEEYPGQYPFSEPETRAVKDFVESHPNIKLALNFHSFGNKYIIPFSYRSENSWPAASHFNFLNYFHYNQIYAQCPLPQNATFGRAYDLVHYKCSGESDDWLLHERGILSLTVELGRKYPGYPQDWNFFLPKQYILPIVQENYPSCLCIMEQIYPFLEININSPEYIESNKNLVLIQLQIQNTGLSVLPQNKASLGLQFDSERINLNTIETNVNYEVTQTQPDCTPSTFGTQCKFRIPKLEAEEKLEVFLWLKKKGNMRSSTLIDFSYLKCPLAHKYLLQFSIRI